MSFAAIQLLKEGTVLTGLVMEDGTFEFMIGQEMRIFDNLEEVWLAYLNLVAQENNRLYKRNKKT